MPGMFYAISMGLTDPGGFKGAPYLQQTTLHSSTKNEPVSYLCIIYEPQLHDITYDTPVKMIPE